MNTSKICSLGYFDRVIVDGYTMPMYNTKGIEIGNDASLVDALNTNSQSHAQGIGKIRLSIYGEADFNLSDDNLLGMRFHRENELLLSRTYINNKDRYLIAYADLLILKSDYTFPDEVKNRGKSLNDIKKLAKSEDEYLLLSTALERQYIALNNGVNVLFCNIAIVDRVYVNKHFRQCGISRWIHTNIADIIKTYGMINAHEIILIPGDFSNEAEAEFGMSKQEYTNILIKHYKSVGYKFLDKTIMCKSAYKIKKKHILNIKGN